MLLPTPLSFIKKVLRILKSNLSPHQIAIGMAFGVLAGVPPFGLHVVLPLSAALLFRCSLRAFLLSMGLFKLIGLVMAPASFALGRWLLAAERGLDGLWRRAVNLPVLAPMDYDRYLLLGAICLAWVLAVPVYLATRALARAYRDRLTTWISHRRVSRFLRDRRGVKWARRLLAGGEAKYESAKPPRGIFRLLRREMLIGLPIAYALAYVIAAIVVPFVAGDIATSAAGWALGTEVAVETSSFSLFTGALRLENLTVQDPKTREENLVAIPAIELDVRLLGFLEDRVVFDRVRISDAALHVVREEDGTLNLDNTESGWNAAPYVEWAIENADRVDWLGLLRRFLDALAEWRPPPPREDPYARYRGGRNFLGFQPPFEVRHLEIGRLAVSLRDDHSRAPAGLPRLTLLEIEMTNVSLPADMRSGPASIRLRGQLHDDPDAGFTLSATFDSEDGVPIQTYEIEARRIDLVPWSAIYATTLPVAVLSGRATCTVRATLREAEASGEVSLLVEDLQIAGRAGRSLFGLPEATAERVVDGINRYTQSVPLVIGCAITGSGAEPNLDWEAPLLEIARQGLLMFGSQELDAVAGQLSVRIASLGGLSDLPLDTRYETVKQEAQESALEILGQAVGEAIDTPTESQDPQDLVEGLLRSLFAPPPDNESE